MPFGTTGPTGGKNGRPQSFHAPIVGCQGAFSCSFYPEYAQNRTPGTKGAEGSFESSRSGDTLDNARQAFLAIMERQDQAMPKSFAEFSATFSRHHDTTLTQRTPRVMNLDLLDEMLSYGKGRARLGTGASRRNKAAAPVSASRAPRSATPDAAIVRTTQPVQAKTNQLMVIDTPPQTAASEKTVRAWHAPQGVSAEQQRCAHLIGAPSHIRHQC